MDKTLLEPIVVQVIEKTACLKLGPELYGADFSGLGIDSLAAIDIAQGLEDQLDRVIDDRDVLRFRSVNDILDYLTRQAAEG